jgi:hypothetical protein
MSHQRTPIEKPSAGGLTAALTIAGALLAMLIPNNLDLAVLVTHRPARDLARTS